MNDTWITTTEYKKHDCEMLWVKFEKMKIKIKIGIVYMPQESRTKLNILKEIYSAIETEIKDAAEGNYHLFLVGDLNCKIGNSIIEGNTSNITVGGRLLNKMLKRNRLIIGNAQETCEGLWTRIEGEQKSVLDYMIMFEEDVWLANKMEIDEAKDITPYYVDSGDRKYTDHCMVTAMMNIAAMEEKSLTYSMVLDDEGCSKYREMLKEEKVSSLISDKDIRQTYPIWREKVTEIKELCSKKVKIQKKWKVCRKLTTAKKRITRELKGVIDKEKVKELKERREVIKQQIEDEEHQKEYTRINKVVGEIKQAGGVNSNVFWKVRRKLCGSQQEDAYAVRNKEGVKCEKPDEIKKIYQDWFQELLTTSPGVSDVEKEAEEIMEITWRSMLAISKRKPPRTTSYEQVEEVIKKLDPRKAKDATSWKNKVFKEGGEEMVLSLKNIVNQVDLQREIPEDWEKMEIRAINKSGDRSNMCNKRGLFLTNNTSKIYEKIVKQRNDEAFRDGISEWQTGGIKDRAPIDNLLTTTSIIEQNKYLECNTYLIFTDAEKCFDKLWLKDGVYELWRCGTDIRDCVMIKRLNERAEIVVKTPVGDTDSFTLKDIVRQGSVYGPQICIATMDKINLLGKDVSTCYGPNLTLKAVVFVDDVTGAGSINAGNNLIFNCGIMEERKKMTFNNRQGKTEYMVIGKGKDEVRTISNKVKKGIIKKVKEHKLLGTWVDSRGDYGLDVNKKKDKLQFMISTVKRQANPRSVGIYTVEARLKLAELVVITSILNNAWLLVIGYFTCPLLNNI